MGQKAVEAHLIRAGGKVFSRLVAWLAALLLLFPVGFITPNAPLGPSPKLALGSAAERLVATVEAALAAWSVAKLTLGTAVKRLVAVTRRAAIGIEFASRTTGIVVAGTAERLVATVEAALAAWSVAKLALGSTAKRLVAAVKAALATWSVTKLTLGSTAKGLVATVEAALATGGTIGFFKTGRGGVAVRAIGAWAREGKLSAAVGSAFL